MQIHSFSKLLSIPFIIAASVIFITFFGDRSEHLVWIGLPVLFLIMIYVGHGEIDYWWLKQNPIPLDQKIVDWLNKYHDFYRSLSPNDKEEFENRLSNYLFARESLSVGAKEMVEVPHDLKAFIFSQCIMLTFGQEDFLLGDFDRIYFYRHPFPTRRYPRLHTFECEKEDQMIILSIDESIYGVVNPKKSYNIALHAYAEAYIFLYPTKPYPVVCDHGWSGLEKIFKQTKEDILQKCGYDQIDLLAVHMVAYFTDAKMYEELYKSDYKNWRQILNTGFSLRSTFQ
jgi:hypothetical protein